MLYPLTFEPIFKERVWGGARLAHLFGKALPPGRPIGESWEISDRPGDESVIANGPLAGRTLRWLMESCMADVVGHTTTVPERFPLLIKLLDAREKLSLQVHPQRREVGAGEPKTEMWFIAEAVPGAELYVGLRRGVTRESFTTALREGGVAECFHRIPVHAGDAMFLPSGRVHAIGAGLVIFEIQQNSDTTYRVYDWDRVGLDGKPRQLHTAESLRNIDFEDFEPRLCSRSARISDGWSIRLLVEDPLFTVEHRSSGGGTEMEVSAGNAVIVAGVQGCTSVIHQQTRVDLGPGEFCLVSAALRGVRIFSGQSSSHLFTRAGIPVC